MPSIAYSERMPKVDCSIARSGPVALLMASSAEGVLTAD